MSRAAKSHAATKAAAANAAPAFPPLGLRGPLGQGGRTEPLRRRGVELLEDRLLLSVSQDANGYTVVALNPNDPVVYVDNRTGSDTINGAPNTLGDINHPLATITAGRTLLAQELGSTPTTGGALLLRRGDVFVGQHLKDFAISGVSKDEPILVSSYAPAGDQTTTRPLLLTGNSQCGFSTPLLSSKVPAGGVNYVDLIGIAFEDQFRDPNLSTFDPTQSGGQYGFASIGPAHDILVEDCSFQYYGNNNGTNIDLQDGTGSQFGAVSNFTFRRNYIANSWMSDTTTLHFDPSTNNYVPIGTTNRAEGLFASGVNGITLEGNVFEHNGWSEVIPYAGANIYSHDCYLYGDNSNCVVTNNLFADAASHGLQARAGGIVTNNLFLRDAVAMSFGYVNGAYSDPGGVTGVVDGNVVVEDKDISSSSRGWGIEIGNTSPTGATVVQNNLFAMDLQANSPAIHLDFGANSNRNQEVGINNLTIQNNTVYGWSQGLYVNQFLVPGGSPTDPNTNYKALNNVKILNNNFQGIQATPIIENGPSDLSQETWSGNKYDDVNSGGSGWFRAGDPGTAKPIDFSTWQSTYEPTATMTRVSYPDPTRTAASYNASIGGTGTLSAFLAQASLQSRLYYRPRYTVGAVTNYIKAGFALSTVTGLPTVQVIAPDLITGGPGTRAFSLTYTDPQQIDPKSLDDGDVTVTGPNGYSQAATFLGYSVSSDGKSLTATYSIPAPRGAWDSGANGAYTISVQANQVLDKQGGAVPAGSVGTFNVNINPANPTAVITEGSSAGSFTVTYTDASTNISAFSAGDGNLVVAGPGGYSQVASFFGLVGDPTYQDAAPLTAQYVVTPPGGSFTPGVYTVSIGSAPVTNTSGTAVPTDAIGTFVVGGTVTPTPTPTPSDTAAPTASASAPAVTSPGSTADLTVTATYTDDVSVDASTLDDQNFTVLGPNGYSQTVTLSNAPASGKSVVATYKLPAPAGGWQPANNGVYYVLAPTSGSGVVTDTSGNPLAGGAVGTFRVSIDVQPPQVQVNDFTVTTGGTYNERLYVTYADASGIDLSTISTANLRVTGPNGYNQPVVIMPVTDANGNPSNYILPTNASNIAGVATPVSVVYGATPPAGGWSMAADGTYSIVMQANQIKDGAVVPNTIPAGPVGSFVVAVAPTAVVNPVTPNPTTTPVNQVTVTFSTPVTGVTVSAFSLTNNGGPNLLTSAQTITTTDNKTFVLGNLYPLTADGGTFTLTLNPTGSGAGIKDSSGVLLGGSPSTTFTVNPAVSAPTVTINDGNAQRSKVTNLTLTFKSPVTLAANAVTLAQRAGPAGAAGGAVPINITNPSGDKMTYLVTFAGPPGPTLQFGSLPDGVYNLTLHAGTISNSSGSLLVDSTTSFHRLFGDVDGNKIVNNADYLKFKNAYGVATGSPAYNNSLDYEANGIVNNADYIQFKRRFGTSVPY